MYSGTVFKEVILGFFGFCLSLFYVVFLYMWKDCETPGLEPSLYFCN